MSSSRSSCKISIKLEFSRQIFEKYSNIKFHANPSRQARWSYVTFRNFANEPKNKRTPFRGLQDNSTRLRDAESTTPAALRMFSKCVLYDFASLTGYIFIYYNSYKSGSANVISDAGNTDCSYSLKLCDNLFIIIIIIIITTIIITLSPLCSVFTLIYLKQTMFPGYTVSQLFRAYC
jgi:hypothetical protein